MEQTSANLQALETHLLGVINGLGSIPQVCKDFKREPRSQLRASDKHYFNLIGFRRRAEQPLNVDLALEPQKKRPKLSGN